MFYNRRKNKISKEPADRRLFFLKFLMTLFLAVIICRLFMLQVINRDFYVKAAENRHGMEKSLLSTRGSIYFNDLKSPGNYYPVAINRFVYTVFSDPALVKDITGASQILAKKLELDETEVKNKLTSSGSRYEILKKRVSAEVVDQIKLENIAGLGFEKEPYRYYPEGELAGQEIGYYCLDENGESRGYYGLEGYFDDLLAGKTGKLSAERGAGGGWLALLPRKLEPAQDGADLYLTIDRTIEAYACEKLKEGIKEYEAVSGTVIILDPKNGAILAMCNEPSFDPNNYNQVKDLRLFNNDAIFTAFEPGSVMKAMTMAAALDAGKVTPETTFVDTGSVRYGGYTIRNAANKAYGEQTMTGVLKESINTGAIFAAERVGFEGFKKYLSDFGFGVLTGVEMDKESVGNLESLNKKSDIYLATASFGQGITATPIQLVSAYGAIANKGKLFKPYVVAEKVYPSGYREKKNPEFVRQVISERSAKLLSGMLTVVVGEGHGKAAGVPGYFIAGKTGTAQIPGPGGKYIEGATNQTFIGFGPVDDPRFVMLVKYDSPQRLYAEYTVVPTFGQIAKFLLQYLEVPPGN